MKHNWIDRFDAFFFDFDGLLVDTERLHYEAFGAFCRSKGVLVTWDFATYCKFAHARSYGSWLALMDEYKEARAWNMKLEELSHERNALFLNFLKTKKIGLMAGVESVLVQLALKNKMRCVVTNSSYEMVEMIKGMIPQLSTIPLWLTRHDYQNGKPSPEGYLLAIEKMGVQGKSLIGFEDTPRGIDALIGAGIEPVFINPVLCYQTDFKRDIGAVRCYKSFDEMDQ